MTKHQQLLKHIEGLAVGEKISVRQMARSLEVSEGTAYRAIKEAENLGLVSSMPRVGTVRIEKKVKRDIQHLTFAEVVNIVDGSIMGGRDGLHKSLNKFLIGAMELGSMARYIEPDSLLIVGDREEAQRLALQMGAAVLITGGFDAAGEIRDMADDLQMPLISSSYDTFTIATMINRAIFDRMIKKDILRVEDIMVRDPIFLQENDLAEAWLIQARQSGHSRFPVVDVQERVVGMVTNRDVAGVDPETPLERIMTTKPYTVTPRSSLASVAHLMVWQGIELVPVVEERKLLGVVTRQDVLKALQLAQRQPQVQMTHGDILLSQFSKQSLETATVLKGQMPPVAMDRGGSVSPGSLMTLLTAASEFAMQRAGFKDLVLDSISVYFLHPVPPESEMEIRAGVIDSGRHFGKVDLVVKCGNEVVCKAVASLQSLD
ncbi:MAG: CBS domain-containing protein [Firmicutes bacterium]|nr:CBS domain-containing protein [Bacillota bacterium]